MENQEVMVVYTWTAKEGKSEELKKIYIKINWSLWISLQMLRP